MGIMIQAGNPLGYTIAATELENGAVTSAKKATDWILQEVKTFTNWNGAASTFADLPAKRVWILVWSLLQGGTNTDETLNLIFNADVGNNYLDVTLNNVTVTKSAARANIRLAWITQNEAHSGIATFNGLGNCHNLNTTTICTASDNATINGSLGGLHNGAAAVTSLAVASSLTGANTSITGKVALYYLYEGG